MGAANSEQPIPIDFALCGPADPLVQPGVTGLWQVSGRSNLSFDEYVRLDLFYIENWSLAYDLFIVAKTIPQLVTRHGAY